MGVFYPRIYLSVNGLMIPCESGSVTRKAKRSADTFEATLSIRRTAQFGLDEAAWADWQPQDVQIFMSTLPDEADLTPMILGKVDQPKIQWSTRKVTIQGRDKSAALIENRRSQKFPNQKSSDICSTIASDYGLNPVVTDTGDYAGKQYNDNDVNHLAVHRTDFEILSDLADREGYRWYVSNNDLIFEPKDQGGDIFPVMYCPPGVVAAYGFATIWDLETSRNMTAARPHNVNVKSWHDKDGKLYNGQAQASGVGDPVNIDHHHNGKTQSQADKLAMSRAQDAIRHDCSISFKSVLNLTIDPKTTKCQLAGTTTIYDQQYDIDEIKYSCSWESGGENEYKCKSPNGRTVSQGGSDDGTDAAPGDSGDSGSSSPTAPDFGSSSSANGGNVSPGPGGGSGFGTNLAGSGVSI